MVKSIPVAFVTIAFWSVATLGQQTVGTFSSEAAGRIGPPVGGKTIKAEVLLEANLGDWLVRHAKDTAARLKAARKAPVRSIAPSDVTYYPRSGYVFRSMDAKAAELARLEAETTTPTLPRLVIPGSVQEFGVVGMEWVAGQVGSLQQRWGSYAVIQRMDDNNAIVKAFDGADRRQLFFWITSPRVGRLRDDQRLPGIPGIAGAWKVTGTKTYESRLGGPRTIFHLEELDLGPFLAAKK